MSSQAYIEEITSIICDVNEKKLKYCCVCFRTEEERKLVEPTEQFLRCRNIMGLVFPCVAICYICEAESKRAYSLLQAIRFASIISKWYQSFGEKLDFQYQMALSFQNHIGNKRVYPDKLGNGVWWQRIRSRGNLLQTEVLVVGGDVPEKSVEIADPLQIQQPSQVPDRPPPAPRPPPLAQTSTNKPVDDSIVIIDDDEDLPPSKPKPALQPLYIFGPQAPVASAQQPPIITAPAYPFENQMFVQNNTTQSNNNIVTQITDITPSGCVLQRLIVRPEESYYVVAPIQNNLPKPQNGVAPIQNVPPKLQNSVAPIQNVPPKPQNNVAQMNNCIFKPQNKLARIQNNFTPTLHNNAALVPQPKQDNNVTPMKKEITSMLEENVLEIEVSPMMHECEQDINISQVRTWDYSPGNSDEDDQKEEVVKRPVMSGRIDWEDKIPMDVISFVDASDPMMHKESYKYEPVVPKRPRITNGIIDLG